MKKFFMIAIMAVAAITANAQQQETGTFSIMPRFGVGYSIFSNLQYKDGLTGQYKDVSGNVSGEVGAEFQYQAADVFALSAGIDYHYIKSADCKTSVGSITVDNTVKLGYIGVPVMAHLTFGGFALGAGVEPMFKTNASIGDSKESSSESFVCSVPVEATYCFGGGYTIGVRYGIPVTKALKNGQDNGKWSAVMLTLGYRLDL